MRCIVRSTDRTLFSGDAQRIVARSPHGEFAVMDGHAPILAVLVPGLVRVMADGVERGFACKGGTFRVADDHATILLERPYTFEEIDPSAIREQLTGLQARGNPTASDREEIDYLELLCRVKENHG